MIKSKDTTGASIGATQLTIEQITERIMLIRRLVCLSLDFSSKARTNTELAQAGLVELDAVLAHAARKGAAL